MEKWFAERRKSKVLDLAYQQMTKAIDTATDLEKAMVAASQRDVDGARKRIQRLFEVETEIDELRRDVFEELTRGSLPSKDREDIMHLVKRLDVMADHVKDAGRDLLLLVDASLTKDVWDVLLKISKDLVEETTMLWRSIEKLGGDPVEVRAWSQKVDEVETRIDDHYLEARRLLLKHSREMDAAALIILRDLLQSLEEVADSCDDTADYVRILTVTREAA